MTGFFLIKGEDPAGAERVALGEQTLVGRSDECDLKVSDGHPSRRHAMLTVDAAGLWVEDLGSANGTSVNGKPVTARTLLANGDRVAFDLAAFIVVAPQAVVDDATVVRRIPPVASDATVVRPMPAAKATPAPAAPSAPPQPAARAVPPDAPKSEAEALQKPVPRSWADPEFQSEGTRILTPEELRALAAGKSAPAAGAAAPAPMHIDGPHLVILTGPGAGTAHALTGAKTEWSIGTAAERDLRLDFPGISAFHAKLSHEDGRWRIIDQMSANGTFVNEQKCTISYLQNGDRLRFAQIDCEIRLPAAGRPASRGAGKPSAAAGGSRTWLVVGAVALATALLLGALTLFL